MEAHARTHTFSPDEIGFMNYTAAILDFTTRASLLIQLGLDHESILSVIFRHSKYSWFVREAESEQPSSDEAN
jgi:hypothetical protein